MLILTLRTVENAVHPGTLRPWTLPSRRILALGETRRVCDEWCSADEDESVAQGEVRSRTADCSARMECLQFVHVPRYPLVRSHIVSLG
jgi:hypothetical protein